MNSASINKSITESEFLTEIGAEIITVSRNEEYYPMPPDEFILRANDILRIKCNVDKIKQFNDKVRVLSSNSVKINGNSIRSKETSIVEIVVTSDSSLE